jgi:hypothetical protein
MGGHAREFVALASLLGKAFRAMDYISGEEGDA